MTRTRVALLVCVGMFSFAGSAFAGPLTMWDFAAFSGGGTTVNLASNPETRLGVDVKVNGLVGSNQDVALVGGSQVNAPGVYVGGYLDMGSNAAICNGAMPCNSISASNLGLASVIVKGGNSNGILEAQINGDIYGNLYVTGDVQLQTDADIIKVGGGLGGNVEYTNTMDHNGTPVVQGTETQVAVTQTFATVPIPGATNFDALVGVLDKSCTGGGCTTLTLGPGSYHDLDIGSDKTLNLTCGNYYFNTIHINSNLTMNIDLSGPCAGQPINIYVLGVADFGTDHHTKVKGPTTGGFVDPSSSNDAKALAALIYLETKSKFNVNTGTEWAGTVFASQFETNAADEAYAGTNINWYGAIYAFDSLDIHQNTTINYVRSYLAPSVDSQVAAVPEPGTMLLLGTGLAALGLRVARRKR